MPFQGIAYGKRRPQLSAGHWQSQQAMLDLIPSLRSALAKAGLAPEAHPRQRRGEALQLHLREEGNGG